MPGKIIKSGWGTTENYPVWVVRNSSPKRRHLKGVMEHLIDYAMCLLGEGDLGRGHSKRGCPEEEVCAERALWGPVGRMEEGEESHTQRGPIFLPRQGPFQSFVRL